MSAATSDPRFRVRIVNPESEVFDYLSERQNWKLFTSDLHAKKFAAVTKVADI